MSAPTLREVMTTPVRKITEDHTVAEAAKVMERFDFGFLVVTDPEQPDVVTGVLSVTDIIREVVCRERCARDVMIKEVMSSQVVFADIDEDTIASAVEKMVRYRLRRLPVQENGRVIGIVSNTDLVKVILQYKQELMHLVMAL